MTSAAARSAPAPLGMDARSFLRAYNEKLRYTLGKDPATANDRDRFLALAYAVRDRIVERWIATSRAYHRTNAKRVYYLSLEFLLGRSLLHNVIALRADAEFRKAVVRLGVDWGALLDIEPDAGLGNGGLGRLAACFLDSLATLHYPAMGYGLRYEYGIFRQVIRDGHQAEEPDHWLRAGNPWELPRPEYVYPVRFGGQLSGSAWVGARAVTGMAYDTPCVGYGGENVNTLRLWAARSTEEFDLDDFSRGDYVAAVESKVSAENLTKVLYPADDVYAGRELRLRQEYFFVSCTLQDILRRYKNDNPDSLDDFPQRVAIQMNDTHPALSVAELMRLLLDQERVPWEKAWELTVAAHAYTNHTLLPEALEKWPLEMMERLLPRHLSIIYEANQRHLDEIARRHPGDLGKLSRMSLIGEGTEKQVRMAHLAVAGSHKVNGVSRIHSELVRTRLLPDLDAFFPGRFGNKTNGITPRRWLLLCNPGLASLVTETVGEGWVTALERLQGLGPASDDPSFRERFRAVKRANKLALSAQVSELLDVRLDPDSLFDVQAKRLHEYKRQLLNILHVVLLYLRLKDDPNAAVTPRTFLFAAKAAPSYHNAKLVIRLIHAVGSLLERDRAAKGKLRVVFLPDYRVTLAERMIPAADLSEQISTAGTEASGTGNMKFALNGALTIGTHDGANVEMEEAIGAENMFLFGLTTHDAEALLHTGGNLGREVYESDAEIRNLVDFVFSDALEGGQPGLFAPLKDSLIGRADPYLHLLDLRTYEEAQRKASALFRMPDEWSRRAALNVARMGVFSSDRTIQEYAKEIWGLAPVRVEA